MSAPPGIAVEDYREATENTPAEPRRVEVLVTRATIDVPFIEGLGGYAARRIDTVLTNDQAIRLRGILQALDESGAKLKSGQLVTRPGHAVQWMLEQFD